MDTRLGQVIGSIADVSQAAFIPGQHIQDHIMLAYELIRGYSAKNGTPRCMIQMDIKKAYDSVEWTAMEDIMAELSIPNKFINGTMVMIKIVSYRILEKIGRRKNFQYHAKYEKIGIINLSFADDHLVFVKGDITFVKMLMTGLQTFSDSTGLEVNPAKCKVYFGYVEEEAKQDIIRATTFEEGELPFKYLGIPLTSKKITVQHCLGLIEKIVGRIMHRSFRLLSFAGRTQLIQSVLFSTSNYWIQSLPMPKKVIKIIEVICHSYLWAGTEVITRKSPVSWQKLCTPKKKGGLNIIDLHEWNKFFLAKNLWNLSGKADSLWI
ncbi:uncharacterized protein LOC131639971 [Vicia villosa]|uniref:uncharacterized protein LOC131639971 n=1 Tax=Vicia villosa TaxID=3911 RepID=UPI00273ADA2D|nr:uncharacterized protein LOC131639971 [Vicia villosa]